MLFLKKNKIKPILTCRSHLWLGPSFCGLLGNFPAISMNREYYFSTVCFVVFLAVFPLFLC